MYYFRPGYREWIWWDSKIIEEDVAAVALAVSSHPFPDGSFLWLMKACGAELVRAELDEGASRDTG